MHSRNITVIELDVITKNITCFTSFKALINAKGNYTPTLRQDYYGLPAQVLIRAYDKAQQRRGDRRRAYAWA